MSMYLRFDAVAIVKSYFSLDGITSTGMFQSIEICKCINMIRPYQVLGTKL